ncbi:BGTF surface domain-containing protein [Haloferax marisrubri]|uniref:PGF-CTERM sorting domain-containing protein n=1 Tax=Haloferax marisrubri TaxID=1544719 RepID=A0A2P4NQA5_9EURY|nr:BGTF surface domain-containing protein [Haloferax marisrubri]POG55311.1 hypothetical protein AUR65_007765 [Haloferax marisrubri]
MFAHVRFRWFVVAAVVCAALVGGATAVEAQNTSSVSLATDDGNVTVAQSEAATITGTSDLEAGTTLSVRVQSTGDTSPRFLKTSEAVVGDGGNFSATLDFSEIPPGSTFSVTVRNESTELAEREGVVVGDTTPSTTSASTTDTGIPGFGAGLGALAVAGLGAVALLAGRRA